MTPSSKKLIPLALLLGSLALPVGAASSAASSASDSVAASVGSISGSIQQSSASSSNDKRVAEGDYRIIEVAREEGRPGLVRLKLAAVADAAGFFLYVPQQVVVNTGLAEGSTIGAKHRSYGLEFVQGEPRRAFFLALNDESYRELQTTAVAL